MLRYALAGRKFILVMVLLGCVLCVHAFLLLHCAYSAEKYGRKSISIMSEVLLTPPASDITPGRSQDLLSAIRLKIKMPRFDYNYMPVSQEKDFWENSKTCFNDTMKSIDSVVNSRKDIEKQLSTIENSIKRTQEEIDRLDNRIKSAAQGTDTSNYKKELDKYKSERSEYQSKQSSLSSQRSQLVTQQKSLEDTLFNQASELLTNTVAPKLTTVLGDPQVQTMRAKEYVDEVERESFIVSKAKELGIEAEDLKKVMDSAYLCLVVLTDYDYAYSRDAKTNNRILTYNLSGAVIWYKLEMSNDNQQALIKLLKVIRSEGSASGNPDEKNLYSKVDPDTSIFMNAVGSFIAKLDFETSKIEDFMLKTGIVETSGSTISFPLGSREGIYIDQKFRVYEQVKHGEQIKNEKRGYFYVTKIANNDSEPEQLSYGKVVISGAEPGMQVKEYPTNGFDFNICFKFGTMSLKPGTIKTYSYDLKVDKETEKRAGLLNFTANYDIGRNTKIPQSFATIGVDVGWASFDGVTIKPIADKPGSTYLAAHVGLVKKLYITRLALIVKPLVQYQMLSISNTDDEGGSVNFSTSAYSFCPGTGLELALRENLNAGLSLSYNIPLGSTNKWSGTYTPKDGSPTDLFDGFVTGPDVVYPKILYGGYINIGF